MIKAQLYILTASLLRGKTPHLNKCPGYDTKLSNDEPPVLELWGTWSTPLLPNLISQLVISSPNTFNEVSIIF